MREGDDLLTVKVKRVDVPLLMVGIATLFRVTIPQPEGERKPPAIPQSAFGVGGCGVILRLRI